MHPRLLGVELDRDVIFLAESGEEADLAGVGINYMVREHFADIDAEFAMTEGGGAGGAERRRACDRGSGWHATEHRGHHIRDPLAEEFPIGVMSLPDAHGIGDGGAQEAFQSGQGRDGPQNAREQDPAFVSV